MTMTVQIWTRAAKVKCNHFTATPLRDEFYTYEIHTDQGVIQMFVDGRLPNLDAAMRDEPETCNV